MSLMRRRRRRRRPLSRQWAGMAPEFVPGVPIDLAETDEAIVLRADLPGMKPEDIDLSVVENRLRLKGEFRVEEEQERGNTYVRERRYGRFERSIDLPPSVDVDAAKAAFENGVLTVEFPKTERAERKQIEVKRPFEEV